MAGLQLADGAIARAPHSEVFVDPQDCGTSRLRPCEHDTWVQTTAFWAAHPAGCATPKVLVNETCIQPAALTSVTPTNALAGSSTTFAVIGTNLPLTAVLQLAGGQCAQPIAQSATGFSTVCTVSSTPGNYLATVRPTIGSSTVVGDATSVAVATPTLPSILDENFDGNLLRGQFWTAGSTGTVSLANGLANFSCYGSASTQGKVSILATQVIVEARAAGAGIDRDVFISLVDTLTGDVIQFGETNYPSNPSWGFYSYGTGIFSMATRAAGSTTNSFMEYRMTISGNQITFERGATLAAISQTVVRTLPTSIAGRQLHLRIGAGGPAHCPATFDWVRVRSQ